MPTRSFSLRVLSTRCLAWLSFLLLLAGAETAMAEAILLEFSSAICPPCRAMQPIVSELIARGVPVRQVDVQAESQLAQRYQIRSTPTYVVVQEGREVTRLVGAQSAAKLHAALQQNPGGELVPTRSQIAGPSARGTGLQEPQTRLAPLGAPDNSLAQSAGRTVRRERDDNRQTDGQMSDNESWQSLASLTSANVGATNLAPERIAEAMPSASLAQAVERAQAATVRLRVHDGRGYGAGTGTIIDVHDQEALVLTCGHLFRDGDGKGKIEVDIFVGGQPRTVEGQLIDYDAGDRDIGLVAIRPGMAIRPVDVVREGDMMKVGQPAFSFGCDRGDLPSRRDTRITGVNKYNQNIGGSNLEISGAPIDGRSGGGLFDEQGRLIGVCNAADYKSDIGIYTGPGSIHWQLDRVQLGRLYQGGANASLASNPLSSDDPSEATSPSNGQPETNANLDAYTHDADSAGADDTEMIVILRDRNGKMSEQVLTLHQPDAQLIHQIRQAAGR